jgi:hypothetical protein
MSPESEDDRRDAIRSAVGRACAALTSVEMLEPDEAGAHAANMAFGSALRREEIRKARRRKAPPSPPPPVSVD